MEENEREIKIEPKNEKKKERIRSAKKEGRRIKENNIDNKEKEINKINENNFEKESNKGKIKIKEIHISKEKEEIPNKIYNENSINSNNQNKFLINEENKYIINPEKNSKNEEKMEQPIKNDLNEIIKNEKISDIESTSNKIIEPNLSILDDKNNKELPMLNDIINNDYEENKKINTDSSGKLEEIILGKNNNEENYEGEFDESKKDEIRKLEESEELNENKKIPNNEKNSDKMVNNNSNKNYGSKINSKGSSSALNEENKYKDEFDYLYDDSKGGSKNNKSRSNNYDDEFII